LANWLLIGSAGALLRSFAAAHLLAYDHHLLLPAIALPMLGIAVLVQVLVIPSW